jgi:crossover junction endodeoxyribonuclease RusA
LIELRLPFPPSTNNLFLNARRGRVLSPEYRAWRDQAGWELKAQKPPAMTERCVIHIDIDDTRQGDCANREKAVTDLLVAHGVLKGDQKKYVKRVSIGWETLTGCRVAIMGVE